MILYRITCAETGKIYIGITKYPVSRRWKKHWANAHREPHSQHAMHVDMRAVPMDRWSISEIGSADTYEELLDLERSTIAATKSNDPAIGYNRTSGGQGALGLRFKKTPEQIERSARHHRGKKLPPERVARLRQQLAWMAKLPRKPSRHYQRDAAIMIDYFSSPSLADTGLRFGINAAAVCIALKRCRERLADNLGAMDPRYLGIEMPQRIHPDHLEFE